MVSSLKDAFVYRVYKLSAVVYESLRNSTIQLQVKRLRKAHQKKTVTARNIRECIISMQYREFVQQVECQGNVYE